MLTSSFKYFNISSLFELGLRGDAGLGPAVSDEFDVGAQSGEDQEMDQDSKQAKVLEPRYKRGRLVCYLCEIGANDDGSNWAKPTNDGRCRKKPHGLLCRECGDFADATPYDIKRIAKMMSNKPGLATIKGNLEEFAKNKAEPENINFPRQTVYRETIYESFLEEEAEFVPRADFITANGLAPDEVKLIQLRVKDKYHNDHVGIAKLMPCDNGPRLKIQTGTRVVVQTPILDPECHLYANQASEFFVEEAFAAARNLGQEPGSKYKSKLKQIKVYTPDEIYSAVIAGRKKKEHLETTHDLVWRQ